MSVTAQTANAATGALEAMVNAYLRLDPEVLARLAALHGKVIAMEMTGPEFQLWFLPAPDRLHIQSHFEGEADCILRGSPIALARLGLVDDKSGELFGGDVTVEGDSGLAQTFGQIFADMDIDWEEHLSQMVGDVPAHEAGSRWRQLKDWTQRTQRTLEINLGEYLQEERLLLPHPEAVVAFTDEVDRLRDDVDRLEARIKRLMAKTAA
jgi:ubiquinone biosynthesis protein UbiJ